MTSKQEEAKAKAMSEALKNLMVDNKRRFEFVYTHDDWFTHKSPSRYLRHMFSLVLSQVAARLFLPVFLFTAFSAGICQWYQLALQGSVPMLPIVMPPLPITLTAQILALLLVFRTNSSYGRWDEARKMWGSVVNRTRNIVRSSLAYFKPGEEVLARKLCMFTIAFVWCYKAHMRPHENLEEELRGILTEGEIKDVMAANHKPTYCLLMIANIINRSKLDGNLKRVIDEDLTLFHDCVGGCERILTTPIPRSYTRHTSRFMVIWLTFLPLAFVSSCGWATVPMMLVLSYLFLGVEQIGVTIEEPFTILALDKICGRIQAVLLYQLEAYETVQRSLAVELRNTNFATKPL